MSQNMQAAVYSGEECIELREVEVDQPQSGQVLIDVKACGICGSDLHHYTGYWPPPKNAGGHELAGVIAEVGEGVSDYEVGDRVTAECFSHCGTCRFCRLGRYNQCSNKSYSPTLGHGGFAEYSLVHASSLYRLPEAMSFEDAALVEPLAVSYRAFSLTGSRHDEHLVVFGSGTIGLLTVAAAKAAGVRSIVATAKYEHQARLARELGASSVILLDGADVREEVEAATEGADAAVETIASAENFADALHVLRPGGRLVLVGGYPKENRNVPLAPIVGKELHVTGSCCYGFTGTQTDFEASIGLIASGNVEAAKTIGHRFELCDIAEAFQAAYDKNSGAVKVMVTQR